MADELDIDPEILNDPVFQKLMEEGLAIQDRFSAEPVFSKTGKGYLKSAGISELAEAKARKKLEEEEQDNRVAEDCQ